jgi:hypothetical protein
VTDTGAKLYLDLLKKVLTNQIHADEPAPLWQYSDSEGDSDNAGAAQNPSRPAYTMIGLSGLDNIQDCVERALANGVPGDLVETGVWRGGVTILMRAILKAQGIEDRNVWVCDSFEGVPTTNEESHPLDQEMSLHNINSILAVSADIVRENFKSVDLLDSQVQFLEGWFCDTLPTAPIDKIAVLRLDGDLYVSTKDSLEVLYPKLSPGGYLIIDDYNIEPCRAAVHEYRDAHGITDEIKHFNDTGAYWHKAV